MFLFIAGCQDNSVDPVMSEQTAMTEVNKTDRNLHGTIELQGMLRDPQHLGNSYYLVSGQIRYNYRVFYMDPMPPAAQKSIAIHFETNADLQYFCTLCPPPAEDELAGYIANKSDDYVQLSGNSATEYEKSIPIQGNAAGLVLKVKFRISYNRIEINAMWLALSNTNTTATEINQY